MAREDTAMGRLVLSGRMRPLAHPGVPAGPGDVYDEALAEYERCHWAAAWALLTPLADRGHPRAARLSLDMHRFGPRLFGGAFSADAARRAAWERSRDRS
jgi:hypothetical protein